jgi:hypothetical protein
MKKPKQLMRRKSPCPKCGEAMEFDSGFKGSYWEPEEEPFFGCTKCDFVADYDTEVDWDNFDKPIILPKHKAQVSRLRKEIDRLRGILFDPANRTKITKESLFEWTQGDFSCDGEPEDVGNAWNCGESDCEQGWHQSCQVIETGRQGDKTWFVVLLDSFVGDCDYQPVAGWDEREGDDVTESILADLWFHLKGRSIEHFSGWAEYCLDVAMTGQDPLNNWYNENDVAPDNAIKAARDSVKYLRQMARSACKAIVTQAPSKGKTL